MDNGKLYLGHHLFLLYTNKWKNDNMLSSPFHFADDTCVLNKQNSDDTINKTLNQYLKELSLCLKVNKITSNATKTETTFLKNKRLKLM